MTKIIALSSICARKAIGCALKHLDLNLGHTPIRNPQAARGGERQVENAITNVGSAVVDHNYNRFVGRNIRHANPRPERQAPVGCGGQIPIECSTARRFSCLVRIKGDLSKENPVY
jgi:hypothetical protein